MTIIAGVSDMHLGHVVGLCPRSINLNEGGTYRANRTQCQIWDWWLDFWGRVAELKRETGDDVIVLFNGDVVELDVRGRTYQLISRDKSTLLDIAERGLSPAFDVLDKAIFVRGTFAHVGKGGWAEEVLASMYDSAVIIPTTHGKASHFDYYGDIDGVVLYAAHRGRIGGTAATVANPSHKLAEQLRERYDGGRIPDIALFGHVHRFTDTFDNHKTRIVTLGGWLGEPLDYVYDKGWFATGAQYGGVIIQCQQGKYDLTKIRYRTRMRSPSKVTLPRKKST